LVARGVYSQCLPSYWSHVGLTTYGISRDDLKKDGLSPPTIERIYRALYVYTVGFHDTMRELFDHSGKPEPLIRKVN
jgi:hypothetical protein